ncbi:DNA cytosine methyltransferase [Mycobacterium cookii]|nr:DNA cytosine methyltransferase [Mycobacterium cookii]
MIEVSTEMLEDSCMRAVGLFSGIGGFEAGLAQSGITTDVMCENWEPAARVLQRRFDSDILGDIRDLPALPRCDVVTAGFPCTDLSQVGRTAGIDGAESGLIREVFRLATKRGPSWLVLENVPNLLALHQGAAIRFIVRWLEDHRWNWAYRTVDSQYFGVRQRRRRTYLVASRTEDPRTVLFADNATLAPVRPIHRAYGFYWTEGNRGLGWGEGVTPTLKGGSKLGIASPPGVWLHERSVGDAIVKPSIAAGERLQGFPSGWTDAVNREGERWKLVGNAVTVPVAEWIGSRLVDPGKSVDVERRSFDDRKSWPKAAANVRGVREAWTLSERPLKIAPRASLAAVMDKYGAVPLSIGATTGFATRLKASRLQSRAGFIQALDAHIDAFRKA